jgi:hypothetical protein
VRLPILGLVLPAAVGLVAVVFALQAREGVPVFERDQRRLQRLEPPVVNALVGALKDPRDGKGTGTARCRPEGSGDLRNPWRCVVSFPGGFKPAFRITLKLDGSYTGVRLDAGGTISGCCAIIHVSG